MAHVPLCDSILESAALRQISPPLYGFPGNNQRRLLFCFCFFPGQRVCKVLCNSTLSENIIFSLFLFVF